MKPILTGSSLDTGLPPKKMNQTQAPRRIGIEIEFGGLYLQTAVDLVVATFGGTAKLKRHNAWEVLGSEIGDLVVEIDADILQGKDNGNFAPEPKDAIAQLIANAEEKAYQVAGEVSSSLVPVEIVTPPLLFNEIQKVEKIIQVLRDAGAEGTSASFLNGFGLHLNPEAASLESSYLSRMLRAFFLFEDILWDDAKVNATRALMPFISKFPKNYKLIVINPAYDPEMNQLIDDYLAANPTRNRDLDMLPLFGHIDSEKVQSCVNDELVKTRPTFHYRLPDCRLEDLDWSINEEWRRWVCIEVLAENNELLTELSDAYITHSQNGNLNAWPAFVKERIHE